MTSRKSINFKRILGLTLIGLCVYHISYAQPLCPLDTLKPKEVASIEAFKSVAIMDQGRLKPMDTFAQRVLMQFSGKRTFNRKPAIQWLTRMLFAPGATLQDKVFLINHPQIPMALGIDIEKRRRYSFSQLEPGIKKFEELAIAASKISEKEMSIVEKEILRVYSNLHFYASLTEIFRFAFPHQDFTVKQKDIIRMLGLPGQQNQFSFMDVALKSDELNKAIRSLGSKKKSDLSEIDKELMSLRKNLLHWSMHFKPMMLQIIPPLEETDETWMGPRDAIYAGFGHPQIKEEVSLLRDIVVYYWNGQQLEFDMSVRALRNSVQNRSSVTDKTKLGRVPVEMHYNRLHLFDFSKLFYGLAFGIFLLSLFISRPLLRQIGLLAILLGFLPQLYAVILRILIMARPPVSTLYETLVFVGLSGVLLGIIIELVSKRWLGTLVASICGLVFLLISDKFNTDGDSMQMLIAVLNSNFWLGTHVLTITIGYGGCCVAGIMAHMYIVQALRKKQDGELLDLTYRYVFGTLAFGLAMTFLGTTLGGIWADQSWGRFWGWDPKENGALLIILWCAVVFHARAGRMIGPLGFSMGCIIGLAVVMWAWFGVNLLNVGLHSYGFTSGIANILILFVLLEIVFMSVTGFILSKRSAKV